MYSVYSAEQLIAEDGLCPKGLSGERRWQVLVDKIQPIDALSLKRVTMDMLDSSGERRRDEESFQLRSEELIELLGGLEGIERLEKNAQILIHLAYLLQEELHIADNIAEEMFLRFRSLWWHVDRLRASNRADCLKYHFDMK